MENFKNIPVPPSYSLIRKGKNILLIKNKFKKLLLEQGVDDINLFLKKNLEAITYLEGRTPHPSVPIDPDRKMVVRHYSHGGIFRGLNKNLYIFGSRSFRELCLTEEVHAEGIPTVKPVGAIHQSFFPFLYQAYFLSLEIPDSSDLAQYLLSLRHRPSGERFTLKREILKSAALLLQKFHARGFFHADLQLKNILKTRDRVLLIDFDHSYRKPALSVREQVKNLLRLNRSVEKWKRLGLPITRTDQWRFCLTYAGGDKKVLEAIKKVMRTYRLRLFFYRLGWMFQ